MIRRKIILLAGLFSSLSAFAIDPVADLSVDDCRDFVNPRMGHAALLRGNAHFRATPVNIAGGQIEYRTYGNPANPPLVLIHGLDSSLFTFTNITDELARDYFVIAYDQRGHGGSFASGMSYFAEVMADDLAALLDHLKIGSADVLGHSMGARTLLAFAQKYPNRLKKAIVEDMELHSRRELTRSGANRAVRMSERMRVDFEGKTFASREELAEALRPYFGRESLSLTYRRAKAHPDGTFTLLFRPWVTPLYSTLGNTEDFLKPFAELKARVLVLASDPAKGAALSPAGLAKMQAVNAEAKVVAFPGTGHVIHREVPEKFLSSVRNFLNAPMKPSSNLSTRLVLPTSVRDPELASLRMLPLGSALATSSGALEKTGITQIIHAASGSMTRSGLKFDPSVLSVTDSVSSALEIARRSGHKRVAIPFIGGNIFAQRIGIETDRLAQEIVARALRDRGDLEIRFVTFGAEDTSKFQRALSTLKVAESDAVRVLDGSITDFNLHGATAIVNAANTEILFGGGLSGVIGRATGNADGIDREAGKLIEEYYTSTDAPTP